MEEWRELFVSDIGLTILVSNLGTIKTKDKVITCRNQFNTYQKLIPGITKSPALNGSAGYYQVHLHNNGKKKSKYVHRLVWIAFNGEIPDGFEIDHDDCDKSNNCLDNLKLLTRKQNMEKMFKLNPHIKYNLHGK